MRGLTDVTTEYLNAATPGIGNIILQSGYHTKDHDEEIKKAEWIRDNFGGDITLLKENGAEYEERSADYLWRNHFWELKTLSSESAIDNALRKAIKQIRFNPGGVVFSFGRSNIHMDKCERALSARLNTSCKFHMDIILVVNGELKKVFRY